ncbi:DUF3042 family protein [Lactococcus garvieae]|jgi:TPP-dependent trihydroxycyclohexane-1,2-dione (THcHDO) dehydratase|uniref:DUF3042 domain-containing protein n=1 Tax=Lactococcus garvieae DCC43 TaxID=1231377 RepID=K2PKB6_9LACT|nr:DUF3042 family protein [Lactococcus garvieae]EKF50619.1 hypothetical protein C426_2055 [Lactococcus garvieae DCC43]QPS70333.1 DUF3042 family protein [Lactococcus garvieae]
MNKNLITGFVAGNVLTLAALFTAGAIYKKRMIDPVEQKWEFAQESRKKANRKRVTH